MKKETKDIFELNAGNFDEKTKKGAWVVDLWASWCNPCKIMEPEFEAAAHELKGKVNFGKVNVEKELEIAERFHVMSIPTTLFLKNGEQVNRSVGAIDKNTILKKINESF